MKYLCLVYYQETTADALSESEHDALVRQGLAYGEELQASGRCLACEALQSVETATTIRRQNGKLTITAGPFAETNEQLGALMLIEARDLNDAIRAASKVPQLRLGCIEVRPVKQGEAQYHSQ